MICAVMFDMDGVLVDSEPAHYAVTVDTFRSHHLPTPDDDAWERVFLGRPDRDGFTEWLLEHHISYDIQHLMAHKLELFEQRFHEIVKPFEDGQWLARSLHAHGVPLALVTGARRAEADLVLRTAQLTDAFAVTISADDVTSGKPDPQPYLRGAAALGLPASSCLVVEDAVAGLRSAEAAGAQVIVVDRLDRPERYVTVQPVKHLDQSVLETILARIRVTR